MTRDSLELRVAREESVFCGTVSNVSGGFIGRSGGYYGGRTFRAYGPRTKACKVLKAWGVNLPATAASVTSGNQFDKPKSVNYNLADENSVS